MKIKSGFVLRQLADTWVVLPLLSQSLNFNGMLTLNETGAFLWRRLEEGSDTKALATALCDESEVTEEQALADVESFLATLREADCIDMQ